MSLIIYTLIIPLLGVCILLFIPSWKHQLIRILAFNISLITFLVSLLLWIEFDSSTAQFQYIDNYSIFQNKMDDLSFLTFNLVFGIDGISLFFVILTTFLIPICLLVSWKSITNYVKEYCIAFLLLEILMIAVFSVLDLLLFYIFFESVLIPMFIIIGVWGSRERKIRAAYQFFLYTLFGSVLMLLAILLIYFQTGTTDLEVLYTSIFSETRQLLLWLAFFASFAVKVPMVPVHIWLPEAHV
jgi:NADH:ubiquinone oxidoreductase subunit 4 (subunit M)